MKLSSKSNPTAIAFSFFVFLPALSTAGVFDDEEARKAIQEIHTKVEILINKVETKADKSIVASIAVQNEQQLADMLKLQAKIELLTNDAAKSQLRQQDFYLDLDSRLRKLEPKKVILDGKEVEVGNNENMAYESALTFLRVAEYKTAGTAFTSFISSFPHSAYLGAAQYWLGAVYYAQKDCKNAITSYQVLVKNFAGHPKTPDGMLNIAACQLEMKDKYNGKKTLETIVATYPNTEAAQAAKARLLGLK